MNYKRKGAKLGGPPVLGCFRGILVISDADRIEVMEHGIEAFAVSIRCRVKRVEDKAFVGVYGPNLRAEVSDFLQELDDIKALWDLLWCIGVTLT